VPLFPLPQELSAHKRSTTADIIAIDLFIIISIPFGVKDFELCIYQDSIFHAILLDCFLAIFCRVNTIITAILKKISVNILQFFVKKFVNKYIRKALYIKATM
jgi:hypothetical protein